MAQVEKLIEEAINFAKLNGFNIARGPIFNFTKYPIQSNVMLLEHY